MSTAIARIVRITKDVGPCVEVEVVPGAGRDGHQALITWACERFSKPFDLPLGEPPRPQHCVGVLTPPEQASLARDIGELAALLKLGPGVHPCNVLRIAIDRLREVAT